MWFAEFAHLWLFLSCMLWYHGIFLSVLRIVDKLGMWMSVFGDDVLYISSAMQRACMSGGCLFLCSWLWFLLHVIVSCCRMYDNVQRTCIGSAIVWPSHDEGFLFSSIRDTTLVIYLLDVLRMSVYHIRPLIHSCGSTCMHDFRSFDPRNSL